MTDTDMPKIHIATTIRTHVFTISLKDSSIFRGHMEQIMILHTSVEVSPDALPFYKRTMKTFLPCTASTHTL